MLNALRAAGLTRSGVTPIRVKSIAVVIIVAASAAFYLAMHQESRADAAAGNCYMADQGPSTPTICQ